MTDRTLEDLVQDTAKETQQGQSTGEWVRETVELLDKRGLLEPILFGPEGAEQVQPEPAPAADAEQGGIDIDAEQIAEIGEGIMGQLGPDVTVAEVVQICKDNPGLVNQQIAEFSGGAGDD